MDLFDGDAMASGYAAARPPLHRPIMERVARALEWPVPGGAEGLRVLDVGCGAGVSTVAATPWASWIVGVDPAATMVQRAARRDAIAGYCVGRAEALPFGPGSVDVMIAAGSLNFVDLADFHDEAARVLRSDGVVVVYDFATGTRSTVNPGVAAAYEEFARRWPRPVANRHHLDPAVLGTGPFALGTHDAFVLDIEMSADAYVGYLMTETNVSQAVADGEDRGKIASWCTDTFSSVFAVPIPIEFDCWFAVARPDRVS